MHTSRWRWLVAVLAAASLLAAACGSSGDTSTAETEGAGSGGSTAGSTASTAAVEVTVPQSAEYTGQAVADAAKLPKDLDGWEALWKTQRDAVVKRIKDNKWGVSADGKTLTGPEGFSVDLSACPDGWNSAEGLTDTEIKIGQTIAQSGTFAVAANYGKGQDAIFQYYNGKGGFADSTGKTRKVTYIQKDDSYDPAKTVPLVDELLNADKVFSLVTLGSPNIMKTYDKVNERCVPQVFSQSGHPAWGDPANHPWTSGGLLNYATEAGLWGKFIEQHASEFPDKFTIAALIVNNEFGKIYDASFRAWLEQSPIKDRITYVTETVDAQAPVITNQMTTLASKNPSVFIAEVAATFCPQSAQEADQNGMHQSAKYLFQPNTCAGSSQLSKEKVGGDGSASEGWWIVNGGTKDIRDATLQEDPMVVWGRQMVTDHGEDPDSSTELGLGLMHGWAYVQSLLIAGQLDGGLNRANLLLAARTLDTNNPFQLGGMVWHVNGGKDAYYTEGGLFQQYDVAKQSYVSRTEVFNLDGQSKNCNFDTSTSTCKLY